MKIKDINARRGKGSSDVITLVSQNDVKSGKIPQVLVNTFKWKFEILLTLFLMCRIIYAVYSQSKYDFFYDGYVEHASWFRDKLIQGVIPIENPFTTGARNRLLYPFMSAIVGLFIPDMHVACAIVNIFTNNFSIILFYSIIIKVTGKKDVAFVSSMIFGLAFPHMRYIWAGMTDSTGIMFLLLSSLFMIKYYENRAFKNIGLVILFVILTTLTRENLGIIALAPLINTTVSLIDDWRKNRDLTLYKGELSPTPVLNRFSNYDRYSSDNISSPFPISQTNFLDLRYSIRRYPSG